ncbi:hypothetical protein Tco_0471902 [Tanacetum coccineum]
MSIEINKKKKLQQLEQVANLSTYHSRHFNSFCYDDDDDEEYTIAITPEKPVDSLIMEDEHLDTIPETESDEFIESSVENLVLTPSESEDFSISNEFNPIHNEDLDSTPKDVRFDGESYLLESLVNHDTLMASPPKIDFLLDEFRRLFYDNSSPRPPEYFHAIPNMIIESLPTFSIDVEDSDSLMEEIDIFPGPRLHYTVIEERDDFDTEDDEILLPFPEFSIPTLFH